jgi:hypothetical protein
MWISLWILVVLEFVNTAFLIFGLGTVFHLGYQVTSASEATIDVSANCAPPPKNCTSTVTQLQINQWANSTFTNVQYALFITDVADSPISSIDILTSRLLKNKNKKINTNKNWFRIDIAVTLPSQASISAVFDLNGSVNNGVFTANVPLYNLLPGNTAAGASGYPEIQIEKKKTKTKKLD